MPHSSSQTFLRELDKKLWTAADQLRSNLDAAVYKHAVLGLIFLKYVSDSFAQHQAEIEEQIRDPESDPRLSPEDFGQESNPTTWRLAAMNMAIRGIDFDFGKEPADTFTRDQHPDLRADFVMALPSAAARSLPRSHPTDRPNGRINPPFNIKEWWDGKLEGDARWKYGTPQGNTNFVWVQRMLHHLAPNGSMSSDSGGDSDIGRALELN
jgi:type I restriction-modification system DNA methylase subunit